MLVRACSDRVAAGIRNGPPWRVSAWLTLTCDVDPGGCAGHVIDEWDRTGIALPVEVARQTLTATQWVYDVTGTDSIDRMRARDRQQAHAVQPRRTD